MYIFIYCTYLVYLLLICICIFVHNMYIFIFAITKIEYVKMNETVGNALVLINKIRIL